MIITSKITDQHHVTQNTQDNEIHIYICYASITYYYKD